MNRWVFLPFISTSMLFACSDASNSENVTKQADTKANDIKKVDIAWVGHYQGVTPCENCSTRCDGCEGTAVDLTLKPDMQFELVLESLSKSNAPKVFTGRMYFKDPAQHHLELSNIKKRHGLLYDADYDQFEILNDTTSQPYDSAHEFILEKVG